VREGDGTGIAVFSLRKLRQEEILEETEMVKKGPQGLTLMELILCMAVMAILLAAASPLMSQVSSGYKIRGAARELATDIQFARLLAVKEKRVSRWYAPLIPIRWSE
jgi:prepilin-type N-terminal cleavage/methylation domain-containing protein